MRDIKCIVVDDELDACDRLENLLNKISGIEVISKVMNPVKAIEEIFKLHPDIVFIDVEMPMKSGFDVVSEIHKNSCFPTFIFVTAYDQYAIKAIRNQAFDFLLKPVDIDDLKDAIHRYRKSFEQTNKNNLPEKLRTTYSLSEREIEIVLLLLQGKSSVDIAETLFISKHTVDTHRRNILLKTETKTTSELNALVIDLV